MSIRWAIMVTGWGRNAYDTIKTIQENQKEFKSKIELVIYEGEPCGAAELAQSLGIDTIQVVRTDFPDVTTYQKKVLEILNTAKIDFIFLLNYKYKIREDILQSYPNRIINVHPSLFPSFLATKTAIQDAIEYGVKITGITTHIIDHELDKGVILCQKPIKVRSKDTFDTLYPIFVKKGHRLIIKTIKKIEKKYSSEQ